jgi:hypothetical protein
MPHGDMRGIMNKARLAEAGRGTYPIGTEMFERTLLSIVSSNTDGEMAFIPK